MSERMEVFITKKRQQNHLDEARKAVVGRFKNR